MILLSIITVCYNAKNRIIRTINSIINQNVDNIEYIIIDGASKDGTVKVIENNILRLNRNGVDVVFVSEPDEGIYDAMNKGIKIARGRYIQFLNAGDTYSTNNTLKNVFRYLYRGDADILYGDYISIGKNGKAKRVKAKGFSGINKSMTFGHESIFFDSTLHKKYLYNIKYKIAADYDLMIRLGRAECRTGYMPFPIVNFVEDGVSSIEDEKCYYETCLIQMNNRIIKKSNSNIDKIRRNIIRHRVYNLFPEFIQDWWNAISQK